MITPAPARQSSPSSRRAAGAETVSAVRRRMVRGGLILVLVLALVDGVFGSRGIIENVRLRGRNAALSGSITALKTENAELIDEIRRLREDPSAIEELARGELDLMKDGELLIILKDVPAPPSAAGRTSASTAQAR